MIVKGRSHAYHMGSDVLAFVLAGGRGTRLWPLTERRAKPLICIAGKVNPLDIALSNLINSGIRKIGVLAGFGQNGLARHVTGLQMPGVEAVVLSPDYFPDETGSVQGSYGGTADAVFQNMDLLRDTAAEYILVVPGDGVYKADFAQIFAELIKFDADAAIVTMRLPAAQAAGRFGVLDVDDMGVIREFIEKPPSPTGDADGMCHVSAGMYLFKKSVIMHALAADHHDTESSHDFGKNVIPMLIGNSHLSVIAYDLAYNVVPGEDPDTTCWWDIGSLEHLFAVLEDVTSVRPKLNLFNRKWPLISRPDNTGPMKHPPIGYDPARPRPAWWPRHEILSGYTAAGGCVIDPGSILDRVSCGKWVQVATHCWLERVIIEDGGILGCGVRAKNVYVMDRAHIPDHARVGFDRAEDEANGCIVVQESPDRTITVVPANASWTAPRW